MKAHVRIISASLTALMLLSLTVPALSLPPDGTPDEQVESVTGSISATLRIDYAQSLGQLQSRGITAQLNKPDGTALFSGVSMTDAKSSEFDGGYTAEVSLRDSNGGPLGSGQWPGYLDLTAGGLPQGDYELIITGTGYTTYRGRLTIGDFSQHVLLGTGDASFTLGDVDKKDGVNEDDRTMLASALGSTAPIDIATFDLNGDGDIDIIDLAYITRAISASAEGAPGAEVKNTALLCPAFDKSELDKAGLSEAAIRSLFTDAGGEVELRPNDDGAMELVIPLAQPRELTQLEFISPDGFGPVSGTVLVEDADGNKSEYPFDNTPPEDVHATSSIAGKSIVTINLGSRVAVKKVTVTVTKTDGEDYAIVEQVRFLQDVVPEAPEAPNNVIRGLTAVAGDGSVNLRWSELPNVEGYKVEYWPENNESRKKSLNVYVPHAEISGLDNLQEYCFTVTPFSGDWTGTACAAVKATPRPSSAPDMPDMISIEAMDGALKVSWKAVESATYYELYFTDLANAPISSYTQYGGKLSSPTVTISGLENNTPYYLYVIAGNDKGKSPASRIYSGTPVSVEYVRPEGIPTEGVLDASFIADVALADSSNYLSSAYTEDAPFTARNVIDGDYSTHWTAANWWSNEHIICTFTQPVDLYSAVWVPRLDGDYPNNLRAYSVRVWCAGDDLSGPGTLLVPDPKTGGVDNGGTGSDVHTWPNMPNYSSSASSRFGILPFGPVEDIIKISVAVEQRNYTIVSLSELIFLTYDPERCLPDNIAALFADELRTELAEGVTQEDIDALSARLSGSERNYYLNTGTLEDELKLARELLEDGGSSGVTLYGVQSRSASSDSSRYGQSGSQLQPLGVAAKAGSEITIYADGIPAGESVTVYATQYNAEASSWIAEAGTLQNGRNILTVPKIGSQNTERGGSLYLTYSGGSPEAISLHVRRATDIPVLELSDWYDLIDSDSGRNEISDRINKYIDELYIYSGKLAVNDATKTTNCLNVTEISMPNVLLSIPAAAALASLGPSRDEGANTLRSSVLAWEDLMHICLTTQGIDGTYERCEMQTRQNIRCMQMFSGAFMYAAGSHIGIGYGSCGGMVCGSPISSLPDGADANGLFGWGIAHEIGHNMDKLGKAEITNNIYSLMVQTYDGKANTLPSRLELGNKYDGIFAKTSLGMAGASNDVFVQLGMYWQLHLAYDSADEPMDFYNRFFKEWKKGTYFQSASSYDDRVALTASGVANRDLTGFFTRWGMQLSSAALERLKLYPGEERAIWYLNDQSRRDAIAGAAPSSGTISLSAEVKDNSVELAIDSDIKGGLQGYEIIRSGSSVAFTRDEYYTDVTGAANNRTYTYQAAAYDTLGNLIALSDELEVRISYDKTVDPELYEIERLDNGDVKISFGEPSAVSGLKLRAKPAGGQFTVSITGDSGDTVTARTGRFGDEDNQSSSEDSYVCFFQKPGADKSDTRIWTYDAVTVTISGIPGDTALEDIGLISYPGDNITFMDGCTAGVLQDDYRYGEEEDDVISAGTLIITGTYRGDPIYNSVRINGIFTTTDAEGNTNLTESYIDGYCLMFAEIPDDGKVSDISDGIFIFVPQIQSEGELADDSRCDGLNLLPSLIKAELWRFDSPHDTTNGRLTSDTLWTNAPGGSDLPIIVLEDDL